MAHDVFLSYPSENKSVADAVCATLEGRKIRCWIAPRDVLAGRSYAEQIPAAIAAARGVVLVFSSHANRSPHIMREVEIALNCGLPIVPLRIENVAPEGGLDYYLKTIHWLDALSPPLEGHLQQLATTLERLLGSAAAEAVPRAPDPPTRPRRPATKLWPILAGALLLVVLIPLAVVAVRGLFPPPNPGPNAGTAPAVAAPKDLDRLQGFWTLVSSERDGKRESMEVGGFEFEFRGSEMWTHERPHPAVGGKLIFRDDMNPRGFEHVFEKERDGKMIKGRISFIYRFLDDDHLELAYPSDDSFDRPGALFPRGFDSTKEKIQVDTLERKRTK